MAKRMEESKISGRGEGRTMFLPPMVPLGARLVAGVFRSIGYDAVVLEEDDESLALGMKHTAGGECVPCPSTVGSLIKAMRERNLPPERVIFFMPTACGPCRFGQYAKLDSMIFQRLGWEDIQIMSPSAENAYGGLDTKARMSMWHSLMVGDIMVKLGCKVRPYEVVPGTTDRTIETYMQKLIGDFERADLDAVGKSLGECVAALRTLKVRDERRPKVGVVGEIYVRSDPVINGHVIRRIEELGGEALLAPLHEWILYTNHIRGLIDDQRKRGVTALLSKVRNWMETHLFFERVEKHYYSIADPLLHDRHEYPVAEVMAEGINYLPWEFEGEACLTLGRASFFVKRDGCKAIVNASPMFCMPGTITTSIFPKMERELGVPIICTFYDGSGDPNKVLVPVMHYLREAESAGAGASPVPAAPSPASA